MYSKISITKRGVRLELETRNGNDTDTLVRESTNEPLDAFRDAMQAFDAYFVELLDGAIVIDQEKLTITTLNFSEDKNGLLGLIVTGTVPVPNAYDKPLVLNTPLVREPGELSLEDAFTLSDEVMEMIKVVRAEAKSFQDGNYKKPVEAPASENTKQVDERMAAAEVASTRKSKGSAKKKVKTTSAPNPGEVMNPGATEPPLTTPLMRQLLLSVERDVPEPVIEGWTETERADARKWAEMRQQELIGQLADAKVPTEPACVIAGSSAATKDAWSDQKPPRPDAAAIDGIKTAVKRDATHLSLQ